MLRVPMVTMSISVSRRVFLMVTSGKQHEGFPRDH
jgi:hypothetical protein